MKFFNKIQNKLVFLLASFVVVILTIVLFIITQTVRNQITEKVRSDLISSQATFDQIQILNYERLIETAIILSEQPVFKENISLAQTQALDNVLHNSILQMSYSLSDIIKTDLFIVTDDKGILLSMISEPDQFGLSMSHIPVIERAMEGLDPEQSPDKIDIWKFGENIYQVVSVPSFIQGSQSILGTLTLGTIIGQAEADTLKYLSNFDVTFVAEDKVIASTLKTEEKTVLNKKKLELIRDYNETPTQSVVSDIELSNELHFTLISKLGRGIEAYYILTTPHSVQLSTLDSVQFIILITGLVSLFISILISIIIGRNFSKPILKLSEGVREINAGRFDIEIPINSNDEIGALTHSFNQMANGLKERFFLRRYVGEHTKQMIREAESTDVTFNIKRTYITVLFSDIRGFTAFSEDLDPKRVIEKMSAYLSVQADLVTRHGGSVDKYVGDEMVAIFDKDGHEQSAFDCAKDIIKATRAIKEKENDPLGVGIGINSGPVVLGNMGSQDRLDYTVIGANVNLGARLCSSASSFQILLTSSVYKNIKQDDNSIKELEKRQFKGFKDPIQIYEAMV